MSEATAAGSWAKEEFGEMDLGDVRRTARLVRLAASAAQAPAGTVTSVFNDDAERQGAYDFLESSHVPPAKLEKGIGEATARLCGETGKVFVAVDGSSLAFVDRTGGRGLGAIGTYKGGARGLKVITALAMSADGVPFGILRQVTWRRPTARPTRRPAASKRPVAQKETRHWLEVLSDSAARLSQTPEARATFVVDREGDSAAMLTALAATGHGFIVRGSWDRAVALEDGRRRKIRSILSHTRSLGTYDLAVTARPSRAERTARMDVTSKRVTVQLKNPTSGKTEEFELNAVRARELGTTPKGEEPIDWMLLTTMPAATFEEARAVIEGYTFRWRIEEFHRTWKSGRCNVEDSQLRSAEALWKWALILATVAVRIERLKLRSRREPDALACEEFSEFEIEAVHLLKRKARSRKPPSLAAVTLLVAELGGYTGKSSGGPPGAVTISRGLEKVRAVAAALHAQSELR